MACSMEHCAIYFIFHSNICYFFFMPIETVPSELYVSDFTDVGYISSICNGTYDCDLYSKFVNHIYQFTKFVSI